MEQDSIRVFAPATVANVSCGYDIMGLALHAPGDELILRRVDKPGVKIIKIHGDDGKLPTEACENTAGVAIIEYLKYIGNDIGVEVELFKKMPLGSGLGSSAASAVAGVFAINELLDRPLKTSELLPFAMEGERIACGTAHADNVAPSLYGGFILIRSYDPLEVIRLKYPKELHVTVVHPDIEIKTQEARFMLKKQIDLQKAVTQFGNIGGMVAGLYEEDFGLIGRSMKDVLVEPVRSLLIPGYKLLQQKILDTGALGSGISGSGPSVFAFSRGEETANKVAVVMKDFFNAMEVENQVYSSSINASGPKILD